MAACGQAAAVEEKAEECPVLTDALVKELKKLLATAWKPTDFKKKNCTGKVAKALLDGYPNDWVKSDKIYQNVTLEDYRNYFKNIDACNKTDKTIAKAEITHKAGDGYPTAFFCEKKFGFMISNRDMHCSIKKYKLPADLKIDDMKDATEVEVWEDYPDSADGFKKPAKKVVRMKTLSFSFREPADKGVRILDYINYNVMGSVPSGIINAFLGNPNEYEQVQGWLENIKKNGGKFKK